MKKLLLPLVFAAAISFVGCKKAEMAPVQPAMDQAAQTVTASTETATAAQMPAAAAQPVTK